MSEATIDLLGLPTYTRNAICRGMQRLGFESMPPTIDELLTVDQPMTFTNIGVGGFKKLTAALLARGYGVPRRWFEGDEASEESAADLAAQLREAQARVAALELENSQLLTWGTDWSVGSVRVWRLRPGQYGVRRRGDYLHGTYDSAGEAIAAARALAAKEGS